MKLKNDLPDNKTQKESAIPADMQPAIAETSRSRLFFASAVTGVFFLVVLFGLVHHEMWRDELQAWLVARDAHSLPGLLQNMRYEGNPALWHFFLFLITRVTHNPVYMQAFHLLIACGFIFVFNRYSAIERPYRILFSFGYFTVYEYSVISRSYGLALLLIVIACALYKNRSSRYILIGIVLALLANVTIYGMIFSIGLSCVMALDYFLSSKTERKSLGPLMGGLAIVALGVILSIYQILPEKDNSFPVNYAPGLFESGRWGAAWARLFSTYFNIPKIDGMNFWNTSFFYDNRPEMEFPLLPWLLAHGEYLWFWYILPAVAFVFSLTIFMRKPLVLLLYACITLALLFSYYYTDLLYARYCGFLLIALITGYWLASYYPEHEYKHKLLIALSSFGKKIRTPFLVLVLTTNIIGAAVAYTKDYQYKFSPSKDVANYIRENKLDTMTIGGAYLYYISPLAAYLDTQLYFYQMHDFGSFIIYNGQLQWDISIPEINIATLELMKQGRSSMLIVSSWQWTFTKDRGAHFINLEHDTISPDIKIDFLKSFDPGIVDGEQYYLYLVHRADAK